MMMYHKPVLAKESIEGLIQNKKGIYVDATFGGGGHAKLILDSLDAQGSLYGFDQDKDAINNVIGDDRFQFVFSNFRFLKKFMRFYGVDKVDGILADLGVSSHQFDVPERGFSFRADAPLDMRMNDKMETTAADIVNGYEEKDLQNIFSQYGEIRNSRSLARAIGVARKDNRIETVEEFLFVISKNIRGERNRYLAQVFQSIRIEVNEELVALKEFLSQCAQIIKPNGKLVVISYHSLEDRIVKRFIKNGNFSGSPKKDLYGNTIKPFLQITRKPILPTENEISINPRARSAKLRIAEKL